jgi:hypothetical protein
MALKIIGPGFGRTGTKSLKIALEQLGFGPCHHMHEVRDNPEQLAAWEEVARGGHGNWDAMFSGYNSQADWPGARYWRELAAHYPNAKVILTVRDPELWYDSMSKTIIPLVVNAGKLPAELLNRIAAWGEEALNKQLFGGKLESRRHAIRVFEQHIADVRAAVPAKRLLVMDVAEGWQPLCSFLGVAAPGNVFPHDNTTRTFVDKEWKVTTEAPLP